MNDRRMIYPYTLTAKIAHFPFKFYYQNNPFFKFHLWGIILTIPIFYKIQTLSQSPANYRKLEEYRKKEQKEYEEHLEHLL